MAWQEVTTHAPFTIWYSQLLLDGRVLCFEAAVVSGAATSRRCCTLTPDINGSYVNGTWNTVASMNGLRYVFTTFTLSDGKVFVTGGEYNSNGYNAGEIYDPILNTWTTIAVVPSTGSVVLANGPAAMLPDGKIIIGSADAAQQTHYIFSHVSDTWTRAADGILGPPSDNSYVLTPDNKIFGYSVFSHANQCAVYDPLTDSWALRTTNPNTVATGDNMGPTPLLYDGSLVMVGPNFHVSRYAYATDTWTTLTTGSSSQAASNAPAATLPNGNALFALGSMSGNYSIQNTYWEFNPGTNLFTQVFSGSEPLGTATRGTDTGFLVLPTGQVLWTESANPTGFNNQRVFVYTSSNATVGSDTWRPAIVSPPTALARNSTTTLTVIQMNGLTIGVSFGNDLNAWTNHPVARLTDSISGNVYYCRTGNLSTRSIAPGTVGSCTLFVPASVPLGAYNLEVIANGVPSLAVSVDVVSGAGSLITADYQYEYAGYLSGASTATMMEKVDGLMSPPDTITHHDDGGVSRHGINYGYENFDARRIPFDFAIDGANGAAAESTYSQFANAYMMSAAYRSAITVPVAGQDPDLPFICRRPGKSPRVAYGHVTRREVSSTGDLAMGLFRGSVELLCGDPRLYSLATHTLSSNIPGSTVPRVQGHAAKSAGFPGAVTFTPSDFNAAPLAGDLIVACLYSYWDPKGGAAMAVPSGWTRYGSTAAGSFQNLDIFYRSASGWTTTTFGSGLGSSSVTQAHLIAVTSGTIDVGQAIIGALGTTAYSLPSLNAAGGSDLYVYTFWSGASASPTLTLPAGSTLQTSLTQGTTRISKQGSEGLSSSGATGVRSITAGGTSSVSIVGAMGMLFFGQASTSTPPVIVNNAGNFPSPRFNITFQGPATNPTITNTTVGRAIRLNAVLSASDIITIDVARKKIYLNGVSNYGLRRADNQWFDLLPGNNTLVFSRSVSNGVNCPVSVNWQDAWESMA